MIRKFYNACWYVVGGIILLAAVCVTLIRLLLPGIDAYREDIENLAGFYSGYPVSIEHVNAEWHGWKPRLFLESVTLHDPDSRQPLASFKSAQVSFAFFASILEQRLIPESLIVSGASLKLIRRSDGSISFGDENIKYSQDGNDDSVNEKLSRWLLSQPLITLQDTSILWVDELRQQPPLQLEQASLNLRTWQQRIQIDGSANLPRSHGESVRFALDARGDLLSTDWSGQAYVEASKLEPTAWPDYSQWQNIKVVAGKSDIRIWSRWERARLVSAEGMITSEDTLLRGQNNSRLIRDMAADFGLDRDYEGNWSLQITLNDFSTWNGDWPVTDIRITGDRSNRIETVYISHLRIEDLLPVTELAEYLPANIDTGNEQVDIHGVLENTEYRHTRQAADWSVRGRIASLELTGAHGKLKAGGLNGAFIANPERGRLSLQNAQLDIEDPDIVQTPVNNLIANGSIDWYRHDDGVSLYTDALSINTQPHVITVRGSIVHDQKSLPSVDIIASITGGDAERLKRLVPSFAKDKLKHWIDRSIVSGQLQYAGMVLRGDLDDFPFEQDQGQFKINARFNEVTMDYHEEWPPIYQIDGDVVLEQDRLTVHVPSGDIYQSKLDDVHATIDNLYKKGLVLNITGNASGTTDDAVQFLTDSPLSEKKTIKRLLELELEGNIDITLDMAITLAPGDDTVSGEIELLGNRVTAPKLDLTLNDTTGHIFFAGDEISSENLKARYYDTNVELSISRQEDAQEAPVTFTMSGNPDAELLTRILTDKIPAGAFDTSSFGNRLNGSSAWSAELVSNLQEDKPQQFRISSRLEGLGIELPAPLGKTQNESRLFVLDFELPPETRIIHKLHLSYADIASAQYANNGLAITLGDTAESMPNPEEISITGETGELSLDDWLQFLMQQQSLTDHLGASGSAWSVKADILAERLALYRQVFDSTRLTVSRPSNQWQLDFTSTDIEGRLNIPGKQAAQPLSADLQRLRIDPVDTRDETGSATEIDPRSLPPLSINIQEFMYGNSDFGKLSLQADKTRAGLRVNKFSLNKSGVDIEGQGTWRSVNDEIFSQFTIDLHASRMNEMLSTFGYYDEAIEGGETEINVRALWPGSPMNFSLASMNGSLELNVTKGTFLDIEPKAARLFGLLSIQTLPRRLSLDFRDLFNKGFAFDRIHGNFAIEDGHAYTNDLTMEGPSALITVTGRTGLVAQNYDQVVTVIPQISDTLPVASALFGPIGIGVGAVIFLTGKMFESIPEQIDKMLGYQYSVKGSWDDPVVEPLNKNQQNEQTELLGP